MSVKSTQRIEGQGAYAGGPQFYRQAPDYDAVKGGTGYFQLGDKGPGVARLQELLIAGGLGPDIDADGKYGTWTQEAVRRIQKQCKIERDGFAGPKTLAALEEYVAAKRAAAEAARQTAGQGVIDAGERQPTLPGPAAARPARTAPIVEAAAPDLSTAAPDLSTASPVSTTRTPSPSGSAGASGGTDVSGTTGTAGTTGTSTFAPRPGRATSAYASDAAGRAQQGEDILRANGQWPLRDREIYVIQIDQDSPPPSASYANRRAWVTGYTGETVVFQAREGRLVELTGPLTSASHAGQFSARDGTFTDVNGDGSPDIAQIHAGAYRFESTLSGGRFNVEDYRSITAGRDINHDGVISGEREKRAYRATAIQLHAGNEGSPVSVGCQTFPPEAFNLLKGQVRTAGRAGFNYVLVRRPNTSQGTGEYDWQR